MNKSWNELKIYIDAKLKEEGLSGDEPMDAIDIYHWEDMPTVSFDIDAGIFIGPETL